MILPINTPEFQSFLDYASIPQVQAKPKTFLEIARQPHYENVISNIYAFYFDPHESHGMGDLFVNSLLACVNEQGVQNTHAFSDFSDFNIDTEYGTDENGRIDLLLHSDTHAIIIENKIYHHLTNNLNDYYQTVKKGKEADKFIIGIVLSIQNIVISPSTHFINITHYQFLKKVMSNIGDYIMKSNDKYLTFLKDLYQNIENMSTKNMDEKDIDFYLKNQEKINQLEIFKEEVFEAIKTKVVDIVNGLEGITVKSATRNTENYYHWRYFISDKVNQLMITINFGDLMEVSRKLRIIVELKSHVLDNRDRYRKIAFNEKEKPLLLNEFYTDTKNHWAHFSKKEYVLSDDDILNLTNYILDKLTNDGHLSVFRKVEDFLTKAN